MFCKFGGVYWWFSHYSRRDCALSLRAASFSLFIQNSALAHWSEEVVFNGTFHIFPFSFLLFSLLLLPHLPEAPNPLSCKTPTHLSLPRVPYLRHRRCGIGNCWAEEVREVSPSRWLRCSDNHRHWSPEKRNCQGRSPGRIWQIHYQFPWRQGIISCITIYAICSFDFRFLGLYAFLVLFQGLPCSAMWMVLCSSNRMNESLSQKKIDIFPCIRVFE